MYCSSWDVCFTKTALFFVIDLVLVSATDDIFKADEVVSTPLPRRVENVAMAINEIFPSVEL